MNTQQLRAAIYVRMSSDRQTDSPDRQLSQILPYCVQKNYLIVHKYEDLAIRGDAENRPGFERLLADAKAGKFNVIVVDEASRFSRDDVLTYNALVAYPLRATGVSLDSVSRGVVDWEDIGSIVVNTVQQHAASQEVVTLSRRVSTELSRLAKEGKLFVGKPPLGFEYVHNDKNERTGLKPGKIEYVQLVHDIFDLYANHDFSLSSLAAELTKRGPTAKGKAWNRTSLHAIITNSAYIGQYVFGRVGRAKHYHVTAKGVKPVERRRTAKRGSKVIVRHEPEDRIVISDHHPSLIEKDLFERAQTKLKANKKRNSPSRKKGEYCLSQKLVCTHCGGRFFATKDKGKPVYRCSSSQNGRCGTRSVREDRLVPLIMNVLEERFLAPENLARLREAIMQESAFMNASFDNGAIACQARISRLNADITKMEGNLGLLDPENLPGVQLRLRKLRQERQEFLTELAEKEAKAPTANFDGVIENVEEFIREAKNGNSADLRALIQETIEDVKLNIEMDQKKVYKRSRLASGEITLKSAVLSGSGTGRG